DVEQRVRLLLDPPVLDDEIELADKRRERTGLGDLRVPPLQRLADPLVRVGAEDVVDAARVRLIRQVQLLREPHVREDEDEGARLPVAKRPDMSRQVLARMREADAAGIGWRLARRRERIVVADEADLDAAEGERV